MIKSDVEIKPEKAKEFAKNLVQDSNNSYLSLLSENLKTIKDLCADLNLKQTNEKIEKAIKALTNAGTISKSEKPKYTYGLRDEALDNYENIETLSKKTDIQNSPVTNRQRSATTDDIGKTSKKSHTDVTDTVPTGDHTIERDTLTFIMKKSKNQNEFNTFVKKLNNWLEDSDVNVKLPELTNSNVKKYFETLSDPLKDAITAVNNKKKAPSKDAVKLLNNVSKGFEWLNNLKAIVGPKSSHDSDKNFDYKYVYFKDDELDTKFRKYLADDKNKLNVFEEDSNFNGKYDITDKKQNPTAWYHSNNDTDKKVKEFLAEQNHIVFK